MSLLRCDKNFVGVPGKVRHESNRRFVLADDSTSICLLRLENILKKDSPGFSQVPGRRSGISLDEFEDKVSGVDLAVRMWIRDPNRFAFVFKNQDVINFRTAT